VANDPRFGDAYDEMMADEPRKKSGCLKGCLIAVVAMLVLAGVAAYVVSQYWPVWVLQAVNTAIDRSDLPAQEKEEVKSQIKRIADGYRAGRLGYQQLFALIENLAQSPLMTSLVVIVVDERYLDRSGLTDAEKNDGRPTLRRFVRGMVDEKIPKASIDEAMRHVADRQSDGSWALREQASDEQLRAFFAAAKTAADAAQIPAQAEDIDPSEEIRKVIDAALAAEQPR
jgi:hypothetical protein